MRWRFLGNSARKHSLPYYNDFSPLLVSHRPHNRFFSFKKNAPAVMLDYADAIEEIPLLPSDISSIYSHWMYLCRNGMAKKTLEAQYDIPSFFLKDPKVLEMFIEWLNSLPNKRSQLRGQLLFCDEIDYESDNFSERESFQLIISLINDFIKDKFIHQLAIFKNARHIADYSSIVQTFPLARSSPRVIHSHLGGTNSGKTHKAIETLLQAKTGIYAAPLRLLAKEIFQNLSARGLSVELITGQERLLSSLTNGSNKPTHLVCTVEMIPFKQRFHVAVIDEIQMMNDAHRGSHWTKGFVGVAADEVHVCGELRAYNTIHQLSLECKDFHISHKYKRLSPLNILSQPVSSIFDVQEGDCIIALERSRLLKKMNDLNSINASYSVLWGSMPPAVRNRQIELFNSGETKILLATDCIGMGVNLSIRRIILDTLRKFDGSEYRSLTLNEIRQLVGRAGRYQTQWDQGFATVMDESDLPLLRQAMHQLDGVALEYCDSDDEKSFQLWMESKSAEALHEDAIRPAILPSEEDILRFSDQLMKETGENPPLSFCLKKFFEVMRIQESYQQGTSRRLEAIAKELDDIALPKQTLVSLLYAPVDMSSPITLSNLRTFAQYLSSLDSIPLPPWLILRSSATFDLEDKNGDLPNTFEGTVVDVPDSMEAIVELEERYQSLDVYLWLNQKLPNKCVDIHLADKSQKVISDAIQQAMEGSMKLSARSLEGGQQIAKKMIAKNSHTILESMYKEGMIDENTTKKLMLQNAANALVDNPEFAKEMKSTFMDQNYSASSNTTKLSPIKEVYDWERNSYRTKVLEEREHAIVQQKAKENPHKTKIKIIQYSSAAAHPVTGGHEVEEGIIDIDEDDDELVTKENKSTAHIHRRIHPELRTVTDVSLESANSEQKRADIDVDERLHGWYDTLKMNFRKVKADDDYYSQEATSMKPMISRLVEDAGVYLPVWKTTSGDLARQKIRLRKKNQTIVEKLRLKDVINNERKLK